MNEDLVPICSMCWNQARYCSGGLKWKDKTIIVEYNHLGGSLKIKVYKNKEEIKNAKK